MADDKPKVLNLRASEIERTKTTESPSSKPGEKPRGTSTARSVASLTTEQRTRKRANDREAQRVIRQRQRDHIASLEQRVRELSGNHNFDKSLEEAQRRNSELEEELKVLRESLYVSEEGTSSTSGYGANALREPISVSYQTPWASQHLHEGVVGFPPISVPTAVGTLDSSSPNQVVQASPSMIEDQVFTFTSTSSSCDDILIENMWPPIRPEPMAYGTPSPFLNQPFLHVWERPLRISPPNGPMESMMAGIIQQQRSLVLSDTTGTTLTGPYQPSLKPLCYPDLSNSTHPALLILSNILRGLTYRGLPEEIGTLLVLYPVSQWQISRTFETYNNLPEWYHPQPSQLITLHPIWITYIGWPYLRDIVIANQKMYATGEFQFLNTISANVNWPYPAADALVFFWRGGGGGGGGGGVM
ncbi:hypothetical protein DL98DRAFT_93623 [Cadophora sp. DSE1049]|nr:hypothetical protein DL98DRAFT_93623 [Cadophora sp. DSE1049]